MSRSAAEPANNFAHKGDDQMKCELCEGIISREALFCPHCKAQRKLCPYCGHPFWHGANACPHCKRQRPNPSTWSLL
ncbi:MAG: zinc ribbon domain-containing protein [bacterium]